MSIQSREAAALTLKKFVTPLAIPPILKPASRGPLGTYYEVKMKQVKQKLHRDLPPTTVWGYNGIYPGPTIIARKNERVRVKWINTLPLKSLLPVDTTVPGAGPNVPRVRTVVHLHGTVARPSRKRRKSDGLVQPRIQKSRPHVPTKGI
jgi:spore coat protein A